MIAAHAHHSARRFGEDVAQSLSAQFGEPLHRWLSAPVPVSVREADAHSLYRGSEEPIAHHVAVKLYAHRGHGYPLPSVEAVLDALDAVLPDAEGVEVKGFGSVVASDIEKVWPIREGYAFALRFEVSA
ncbi:hypothetical protein [Streptomyces coelicoflavus]|uniref:hypothetical protein n=1 Tax=Streptomyces coelicoflavus TaxID=285562 RepID=UPI0036A861EF